MIPVFNKRRKHMLAMKAMREGQIPAASPVEVTCPKCQTATARQQLSRNQYVCPNCGHHFPIGAYFRLSLILDSGSFRELDENLTSADPMEFPGYSE